MSSSSNLYRQHFPHPPHKDSHSSGVIFASGTVCHKGLVFSPEAKRSYERKKARTNPVVTIKALANKLARACFHILKERKPFEVMRCFAWVTTAPVSRIKRLECNLIGLKLTPGAVTPLL